MQILTADEIRAVEERENQIGTDFLTLMERAGKACADQIMNERRPEDGVIAIAVGKGKNGGDGFVIGRYLKQAGYRTAILLGFGEPTAKDAVVNRDRAVQAGVPLLDWNNHMQEGRKLLRSADAVVDALFGIGFHGSANQEQAVLFEEISRCPGQVYAIDVPSGVETDTGAVRGTSVRADTTFAISTYKPAHVFYPARACCGEVKVLNIGLLKESYAAASPSKITWSHDEVENLLPIRSEMSHKNDFGHVLSVCGSMRLPGAACMCSNAAVRAGAGLTTAAFPRRAYSAMAAHLSETIMMLPLPDSPDGTLSVSALPQIHRALERATVCVIGCGLGQTAEVRACVTDILQNVKCPAVLDADGLNAIAAAPDVLQSVQGEVVVTPHPGEMARLMNCPVSAVQRDRVGAAAAFAKEHRCTVLLKGPDTIVASCHTNQIYINTTGNQGLAKGGSGDTLSGIIAALLAQGMAPFYAASVGAWLHGYAADCAAEKISYRGMCASDLIEILPFMLREFE